MMAMRAPAGSLLAMVLALAAADTGLLAGQDDARLKAMASWVAVDAPTGYETRLTPAVAEAMDGWSSDRWGNLVAVVGSGSPRRIVACALDRPSYAASQITADGYLRVHRIGRGSNHPLWDQAFEAQHVRVMTRTGPVAGVVARSNGHFSAQHRHETAVVGADDLWVDVGAESAEEVAGPDAGRRVGCAAVATMAEAARDGRAPAGETHFVMSAQEVLGWIGLSSYVARGGSFDQVVVLAPGEVESAIVSRPADSFGRFGAVLESAGLDEVTWIVPAATSPGSHMEQVRLEAATTLLGAAAAAAGIPVDPDAAWVPAPPPAPLRTSHVDRSLDRAADLLRSLVDLYAVPDHEWPVRRLVLESLPQWALDRAVVDDMGNVMVEAGPERDTTVFMAHMDEVGYEVESIAPDGVVTLRRKGGAVATAWEGQTALLHFDPPGAPSAITGDGSDTDPRWKAESLTASAPPPIPGVFLTRDVADGKNVTSERAWFGMNAEELAARGVREGNAITMYKEGLRLGRHRFVARGLDDRAGTTAILLAVHAIDPDELDSKVIFTWSVHEEGGLRGAGGMARRYARTTQRIFSVDTFVSSDTPLETPHFAHALLGSGPVLRAIENSGVSPDRERQRVINAAREAGIPLQIGLTQGGTDGTQFTFWGAPNQGLSWPGRYSHSPGEVLDLRDLEHLGELIAAMARTGG